MTPGEPLYSSSRTTIFRSSHPPSPPTPNPQSQPNPSPSPPPKSWRTQLALWHPTPDNNSDGANAHDPSYYLRDEATLLEPLDDMLMEQFAPRVADLQEADLQEAIFQEPPQMWEETMREYDDIMRGWTAGEMLDQPGPYENHASAARTPTERHPTSFHLPEEGPSSQTALSAFPLGTQDRYDFYSYSAGAELDNLALRLPSFVSPGKHSNYSELANAISER